MTIPRHGAFHLTTVSVLLLLASAMVSVSVAADTDLTDQLKSKDAKQRFAAAQQAQSQSPLDNQTLDQLRVMATKDQVPAIRGAACEALGAHPIDAEKTIPVLIAACADNEQIEGSDGRGGRPVYDSAGAALAKFEDQSMPYLKEMLKSDDSRDIMKAGLALDHLGPYAAGLVDELVVILERQRPREIVPAVNAVRRIGPPAKKAVPALGKLLDHENFHIQYWTCRAISGIGPGAQPLTDKLIELLKTGNGSVRRHAAESLGKIGPTAGRPAVDALIEALNDSIYPVQANAAIALGDMAPASKPAKQALMAKLEVRSFNARAQAAQALWQIDPGNQTAIDVLLEQLNDHQAPYEAVDVVANVAVEMKIVPQVAKALESDHATVREAAALSLAKLGKQAAPHLAALRKMAANDPDEEARQVARGAVSDIENAP